jgi:hypothetical protein
MFAVLVLSFVSHGGIRVPSWRYAALCGYTQLSILSRWRPYDSGTFSWTVGMRMDLSGRSFPGVIVQDKIEEDNVAKGL